MRFLRPFPILFCALALLSGCDRSPSEPDETLLFEGVVPFQGSSMNDFVFSDQSIAKTSFESLEATLPEDFPQPELFQPRLAFVIGDRAANGSCAPEAQFVVRQGDLFFFSVGAGAKCLDLRDQGLMPEGAEVAYRVVVEATR